MILHIIGWLILIALAVFIWSELNDFDKEAILGISFFGGLILLALYLITL